MQQSIQEAFDAQQVKLMLSLKNDEIQKLKASLKGAEIKNNLRQADLQYKVDNLLGKLKTIEQKMGKTEVSHRREKLEKENIRLNGELERVVVEGNQRERELNGAIYEERLELQREREVNSKLTHQLQTLFRHFDPKKVLPALCKASLSQIPTYLDLYSKYIASEESLQHLSLHASTLKSQVMKEMQHSFLKMKSYENIMDDLRLKNQELKNEMDEKQMKMELHTQEISSKKSLIERIKEEADQHFGVLNQEILVLRNQVAGYEKEVQVQGVVGEREIIEDLERKIISKEIQIQNLSSEYHQKLLHLEEENNTLHNQLLATRAISEQNLEQLKTQIVSIEIQLQNRDSVVTLMQETIEDQDSMIGKLKGELQRRVEEINEMLRKKRKNDEDIRVAEEYYQRQIGLLNQEISQLRGRDSGQYLLEVRSRKPSFQQNSIISNQECTTKKLTRVLSGTESIQKINPRNLLYELNDQINLDQDQIRSNADYGHYQQETLWSQKYFALLERHNQFAKAVCSRLKRLKE